jgi:hypothetical protein
VEKLLGWGRALLAPEAGVREAQERSVTNRGTALPGQVGAHPENSPSNDNQCHHACSSNERCEYEAAGEVGVLRESRSSFARFSNSKV